MNTVGALIVLTEIAPSLIISILAILIFFPLVFYLSSSDSSGAI